MIGLLPLARLFERFATSFQNQLEQGKLEPTKRDVFSLYCKLSQTYALLTLGTTDIASNIVTCSRPSSGPGPGNFQSLDDLIMQPQKQIPTRGKKKIVSKADKKRTKKIEKTEGAELAGAFLNAMKLVKETDAIRQYFDRYSSRDMFCEHSSASKRTA